MKKLVKEVGLAMLMAIAGGRSGGDIYWYDYHAPDNWTRHLLGSAGKPRPRYGVVLEVLLFQ